MMYFLMPLREFKLPQELLIIFYTAIVQSVLSTSITVWFGASKRNNSRQQTLKSAETNRLYSRVILVRGPEECWYHLSGPFVPQTQPLRAPSLWQAMQSTLHRNNT